MASVRALSPLDKELAAQSIFTATAPLQAVAGAFSRVTSQFFVLHLSDTALSCPESASCSRRRQLAPVITILYNNRPSFVIMKQWFR